MPICQAAVKEDLVDKFLCSKPIFSIEVQIFICGSSPNLTDMAMLICQAEKMNSRAAMIGFFALLAVEGITGKGLLELLGWNIGNGLDIGL
jgi:hypothetical protein